MRDKQPRYEEPNPPSVMLRRRDIEDMVADGTIENQHFLIKLLAENLGSSADKPLYPV